MLSDSLELLLRHLIPVTARDARMVRLTPVSSDVAQEACWRNGCLVAKKIVVRLLQRAGISLEPRGGAGQPMLVWARLEQVQACGGKANSLPSHRLAFYQVDMMDRRPAAENAQWLIEAYCWRRGPDGSIALYEVAMRRRFVRVFESETETIDNPTATAVAASMLQQIANELGPQIVRAVLATQGADPDQRPEQGRLS